MPTPIDAASSIRGYAQGQRGGAALVTIDGRPLGLPTLGKHEARHSPDGFQWGYAGSGPTELARAILIAACPDFEAFARSARCYQRFKFDVVVRLPRDGFEIPVHEVRGWMKAFVTSEEGRALADDIAERQRLDAEIAAADAAEHGPLPSGEE